MLALTRKKGESLVVNNNIEITVLEIRGDQVKSVYLRRKKCRYTAKKYIFRFRMKIRQLLISMRSHP